MIPTIGDSWFPWHDLRHAVQRIWRHVNGREFRFPRFCHDRECLVEVVELCVNFPDDGLVVHRGGLHISRLRKNMMMDW